jgi:predicted DNA binding CopG/RHH family protein
MAKNKKLKPIPKFKNEDEEREFWATHSSVDYFDLSKAEVVHGGFTNLKPSTQVISIRLPLSILNELKIKANKLDVAYQSLIKIYLAERIEQEKRSEGKTKRRAAAKAAAQRAA